MAKLSILIPANNEMFLARTVQDILEHIEEDTEILVGLDGAWADPVIPDHPRVKIFHSTEVLGQRAMTNQLARLSKARYVAKTDAHCSFDQGFDRKMIEFFKEQGDDMVAVPIMRNLHAFDWVCKHCGWRTYQGRQPQKCGWVLDKDGKEKKQNNGCEKEGGLFRDVVWIAKNRPNNTSYCFDHEPHFQYYKEYERRPEYKETQKKGYNESMSLQGSFFMATRHNYWKYQLCDERAGNWGNQGIELACAAWLSGLRVLCNHKTWYAHLFRTQGGDFGFPWVEVYENTQKTKKYIVDKFWNKKHPLQIHSVSWLIKKFMPVADWTEEKLLELDKK